MKTRFYIIAVLLLLCIIALTSCRQDEWPTGRDTVQSWKQGKIQIVRDPNQGLILIVDHKVTIGDIKAYRSDGRYIYLVQNNRRVFERFSLEDEAYETYFGLDSITDERTLRIISEMMAAIEH